MPIKDLLVAINALLPFNKKSTNAVYRPINQISNKAKSDINNSSSYLCTKISSQKSDQQCITLSQVPNQVGNCGISGRVRQRGRSREFRLPKN